MISTNRFQKALEFTLQNEGGLSNDPDDLGGSTIYGISIKWYQRTYWELRKAKTQKERETILHNFYFIKFWNPLYSQISSERLAIRLFDLGVNLGVKRAVKLLQKAINSYGENLTIDGVFGKNTLKLTNKYLIYDQYINIVKEYYETRSTAWKFLKGWLNRLMRPI